jgi:hypothetical protein
MMSSGRREARPASNVFSNGVISDLGKAAPSQQDAAPATTQAKSTTDEALHVILASVVPGEITPDDASALLGQREVHSGTNMREILDAVAKGWLLPEEAAVFFGGDHSRPSSQPQPSTPGVPYGLIDEARHQELIEIHPSEGKLPPDATSHQEAPATAQPGGKPTRRKASRRPKKT